MGVCVAVGTVVSIWARLVGFLRSLFARRPPIAQDTTPPSDVTGFTATLNSTQVTLDSDPGVDPAGIGVSGYHTQVSLNGTFSDAVDLAFSATTQQVYQGVPNTTPYFRRKAHKGNNGLESVNWVASTPTHVTIPNTLAADSTNPPKPSSAPTLLSHDSTNIAITLATVLDDTTNSATQIVTGVVRYLLKRNGTLLPTTYTNPVGPLAGIESVTIGSPAIAGSYGVVSGTYTLVCGGENGWFGTTDQGRIASAPMQGDFTVIAKVNSVTSAYQWEKCGIIVQDGLAANAAYFSAVVFSLNGWNRESRPSQGASASQDTLTSTLAAKPWVQITRVGNVLTAFIAADSAGSPGTFTQLGTAQTIPMSAIVEVGMFCSSGLASTTTTAVFSGLSITGNPSIVVHDTGLPSTAYSYTYAAQDGQGNIGIYSDALSVTTDASGGTTDGSGLAMYGIGNQASYDKDATIALMSLMEWVCINFYEGWQDSSRSKTTAQIVDLIHNNSPLPTKPEVHHYYDSLGSGTSSFLLSLFNKITSMNWFLRTSFPSGSILGFSGGQVANTYPGSSTDTSGRNIAQWLAQYRDDVGRTGGSHGTLTTGNRNSAANIDGAYEDDVYYKFPVSGADFNRDGSVDASTNAGNVQWMTGQKQIQVELDALWPAGKRSANLANFFLGQDTNNFYNGYYDSGVIENSIGDAASTENFGWSNLLGEIAGNILLLKNSRGAMLSHNAVNTSGQDVTSAQNTGLWQVHPYQSQRFGFCTALVNGFRYGATGTATGTAYDPTTWRWLDEYAANSAGVCQAYAGSSTVGLRYRGPIQGTTYTTLSNGILRRDFLNCIVLVNPRSNASRTFTLGGTQNYVRMTGSQASGVNSGAAVGPSTSITMPERSGLILMKAA